ncbi:M56 family metallopeptidase [Olleya sp. Bg11-27]|uniref:M56 family metallopeptidase n=1 Tax=Olleya sp. Bg11-27 TaxID=2058135 RepID=UPI000C30C7C7|nr:M56 family metallopeptidase [Olleya sp. Bg11-27]AUC74380.1 blaR1 peptidase M56 family protein [Olleya sp. Bg11-27]
MLHFIFQTILFQLFFLIGYDLFLKRETFFNYNRVYLLITSVLSIVIPLIKIERFNHTFSGRYLINLPEIFIEVSGQNQIENSISTVSTLYLIVSVVMFGFFLLKLFRIVKLIRDNTKIKTANFTIVYLKTNNSAFSFFNYIFLGSNISKIDKEYILEHERIHVTHKHTIDLLWFETLKIIFWFNPLVYIYQNRVSNLHEFIADKSAVKANKSQYYQQLLQQVFSVKDYAFINPFFKQSLIKKRIIMLQKSNSKQTKLAKYLLLVPMVLGMLVYSSCSNGEPVSKDSDNNQITPTEMTIVEDVDVDDASNLQLDVPFSKLDQSPMFEVCQSITGKSEQKKCFSDQVTRHIATNFNTKLGKDLGLEKGEKRINVMFRIDKTGQIIEVKARAPHPDLEAEAIRLIKTLPKITPAMHEGKTVNVTYALPIMFKIN